MNRKLKSKWIAVDGSIYTVDTYHVATENKIDDQQDSIAFNVGQEVARHIVMLHNNSIESAK